MSEAGRETAALASATLTPQRPRRDYQNVA
jgi:hypothetical protein